MKTKITLASLVLILVCFSGNPQTIWTGPPTTFERENILGLNLNSAINQDRITGLVWITRDATQGIFNIKTEPSYINISPADTEWAFGTTANIEISFSNWETTVGGSTLSMLGRDMVLHLITDDIYIDIKFISWAEEKADGHGGFSYERSTEQSIDTNEFELNNAFNIFPNPSHDFIQIIGLTSAQKFKIHNVLGLKVLEETIEPNKKIDIENLVKGIYFIHFENGTTLKFVKN